MFIAFYFLCFIVMFFVLYTQFMVWSLNFVKLLKYSWKFKSWKNTPLEKVAKTKTIKYSYVFSVFQSSHTSNIFLSSSSLKSSMSTSFSHFSQSIPLQFLQAETHTRPCFLQLQVLVLHGRFLEILQLYQIKQRILSGAAFKSVIWTIKSVRQLPSPIQRIQLYAHQSFPFIYLQMNSYWVILGSAFCWS